MKRVESKKTGIAPIPPTILTIQDLAQQLRRHPSTIYRLLRTKQIPSFRVGGGWRFHSDAIDRWCSEEEKVAVTAPYHKRSS